MKIFAILAFVVFVIPFVEVMIIGFDEVSVIFFVGCWAVTILFVLTHLILQLSSTLSYAVWDAKGVKALADFKIFEANNYRWPSQDYSENEI